MDRLFFYPSEQPTDTMFLTNERNVMVALGYLAQGVLGTTTVADGLSCIPTVPASLAVQILPGAIYQQEPVDSTVYGSLAVDTVDQIIKQGIVLATTSLTLTPPGTVGQAINYLIEASFLEQDTGSTVLSYFNSANPTIPFSGPNGLGTSQPTIRQGTLSLVAKAGTAATAGSQVTPAPDAGYVGLWVVTVANGATQLTSTQISQYASAPFISVKLPQVPTWVQGGTWAWAADSGTANQVIVTMVPTPATINAGFEIRVQKMASPSTGAMTIIVNGASPVAITYADGSALTSTTPMAGGYLARLVFNGTAWRWTNAPISTAVGSLGASSGEGINVTGGGIVNLNYPGLSVEPTVVNVDLWSFYSQADTHHRVMSWAQLLAALRAQLPISILTAPATYFVNPNTGNDSNDGLTSGTALATVNAAIAKAQSFNMNGFNVTITCANGTYAPFSCGPLNGAGQVSIIGNVTTPSSCLVHATTAEAIAVGNPQYYIQGFAVQSDARGSAGHYGAGLRANASVKIGNMQFNACFDGHIMTDPGGTIVIDGAANGLNSAFITIGGAATWHMAGSGTINVGATILNINPGTYSFSIFAFCTKGFMFGGTTSGGTPYQAINNSGTVLGQRFVADRLGVISVNGAGDSYFPGSVAGVRTNGGVYA